MEGELIPRNRSTVRRVQGPLAEAPSQLASLESWVLSLALEVKGRHSLDISGVRSREFRSEEDPTWTEYVIEVQVNAPRESAIAFWGQLSERIDRQKCALAPALGQFLDDRATVFVVW